MEPVDADLLPGVNQHFVVAHGDASLKDALQTLMEHEGQGWWYLVVDAGARFRFLAVQFDDLRERIAAEQPEIFDVLLKDLGEPLVPVHFIDRGTDLTYAQKLAADHPNGLVVVVEVTREPRMTPTGSLSPLKVRGVFSLSATRGAKLGLVQPPFFDFLEDVTAPADDEKPKSSGKSRFQMITGIPDGIEVEVPPSSRRRGLFPIRPPLYDRVLKQREEESSKKTPSEPRDTAPSVDVDGSVTGDVLVAGGDVNQVIHVHQREKMQEQKRRFESAFPRETHKDQTVRLWVAVMAPDQPSPFKPEEMAKLAEDEEPPSAPVSFPVDAESGEMRPVEVDITVTGVGFEVVGQQTKKLTVWPDGRMSKRWFLLKAVEVGTQKVLVEVTQGGRLLQEFTIEAAVFTPKHKPHGVLSLSFQVNVFSFQLRFSAGSA